MPFAPSGESYQAWFPDAVETVATISTCSCWPSASGTPLTRTRTAWFQLPLVPPPNVTVTVSGLLSMSREGLSIRTAPGSPTWLLGQPAQPVIIFHSLTVTVSLAPGSRGSTIWKTDSPFSARLSASVGRLVVSSRNVTPVNIRFVRRSLTVWPADQVMPGLFQRELAN